MISGRVRERHSDVDGEMKTGITSTDSVHPDIVLPHSISGLDLDLGLNGH